MWQGPQAYWRLLLTYRYESMIEPAMGSHAPSPYHHLEPSKRKFRLLRLLDDDAGSDGIHFGLKVFSLVSDDIPPWIALIYRWGEDEPKFTVHLNDQAVLVRKNLHICITQLVVEKRRDWYYIDALCIDQSNEAEKPGQVREVSEIYKLAEEVIAWIVYEPHQIEECSDKATYDPVDGSDAISSMSRAEIRGAVVENSYWSRLWIVQEVLLAKRLSVQIGAFEVDWYDLLPEKSPQASRDIPVWSIGVAVS
jgi:hypothetical protein